MPHGAEEECQTQLVTPDMSSFLVDFGHPHGVAFGIQTMQRYGIAIQLIAEDEYKISHW
jgi:hypothetical protein